MSFGKMPIPSGIVMFEDLNMGDAVENTSYDQFYDEHIFLFSVLSISYLFEQHSLEVIYAELQWTQGGSVRYVIAEKGTRAVSKSVHECIG